MNLKLTKFGQFCHRRRIDTCRSLASMAEAMGMEAEHLSAIEHGDVALTEIHVEKVAEYFGVKYEYLLPHAFPERFETTDNLSTPPVPSSGNVISIDDYRT